MDVTTTMTISHTSIFELSGPGGGGLWCLLFATSGVRWRVMRPRSGCDFLIKINLLGTVRCRRAGRRSLLKYSVDNLMEFV